MSHPNPPRRRKTVALSAAMGLALTMSAGATLPSLAAGAAPAERIAVSDEVERLAGADRYETSFEAAIESGGDVVFLASGEVFADALTARTPVNEPTPGLTPQIDGSGSQGVPVLLTPSDSLTPWLAEYAAGQVETPEQLTVVIVGGEGSVEAGVEEEAIAAGYDVSRIGGDDRYDTAALLSEAFNDGPVEVAFVAAGEDFPDALSGGALASAWVRPCS
ncbi:cell wall-binding repeat-containing protein [Ornithinimicrobium sp. INDO-MA30-4]|uniref:cell wall-binding repeat-containing protein n=1 Tax=Ornithinimicrobium sp. INDO-MA30-4 TaxID=2908651 RepID=UPI001F44DC51|nr:cell wall-binding repeat-containing protein [Ornithinimicrobium sp. INDO-MA30-4]UJH69936.1 cell wall-binding repeat-containing protein [Ornithinimicrobium sp. INDO-MA30-4]